ncbi:MAG: hypothetical protein ACHQJ6_06740 [Candidatus Berkiellales bacterium]
MTQYSPLWPHGDIKEIFSNIYYVAGTNITTHEGMKLQHSRNMVIVKNNDELTLINTVRLNDKGLAALEKLGKVINVVRIGAFHGRDDAFYLDRYAAKLWAIKGMKHEHNKLTDFELTTQGKMPFPHCSFFNFETSSHPEGILHIHQEGGILITCDSIKNWTAEDAFFTEETAMLYQKLGLFGSATISKIWQQACNIKAADFARLKLLTFRHLISAHGEPLLNEAHEKLSETIQQEFSI